MPCHVRSTSKLRHRHKLPPSLLRQVRLLKRLSVRGLRLEESGTPAKPSGGSDGQGAR